MMRGRKRPAAIGVQSADDAKALPYLHADENGEERKLPMVPPRERLDTHQLDVGAEHASGWSIKSNNPKPTGSDQQTKPDDSLDPIVLRDAGEVNRVQYERIKELRMPLSDNAAQALPLTIRSGNAPDFKSRDPNDEIALSRSSINPGKLNSSNRVWRNQAAKMGLDDTSTPDAYKTTAMHIRLADRHVGAGVRASMAYDPGMARTATDLSPSGNGAAGKLLRRPMRVRYNPLIAPGLPLMSKGFKPDTGPRSTDVADDLPGSVSSAYVARQDSEAANDLEQLVVTNAEATQNALDKGIFSPKYRNMQQYPAVVASMLRPVR